MTRFHFFSGELMRHALGSVPKGDLQTPFLVRDFIREVHAAFMTLKLAHRDLAQKLDTLEQCLLKVERGMIVQ
jgi:predicted translin family RNA/ssDNA-binding protein